MILCSLSMSVAELTSSPTERLLVLRYANSALRSGPPSPMIGAIDRVGLPQSGRSILITSAPKSASSFPQYSPATDSASSTILIPVSADMHYLETSGLVSSRAAEPPLRREIQVVVFDDVVEALFEGARGEVDLLRVVLDQRQHAFDHPGEQAAEVFAFVLLVELQEGLLHRDGVGWARLRACQRVFQRFVLQLVAGHHAVDEAAVVHLLGTERSASEQHFGELPQAHRLGPPPQAWSPTDVTEGWMPEKRIVRRDHQIGVAGLVEVPAIAIALGLDDADLAQLLQRPATGACLGVEIGDGGQIAIRTARRGLDVVIVDRELVQQRHTGVLQHRPLFGQVPATTEILALATDHHDLDLVVDVALVDQVGVVLPHAQGGGVLRLRTIEGDVGDSVLLVLLEPDVLLGFLLQFFVVVLGHNDSP